MSNPIVTIEMENGKIMKAELYPEIAPNSVKNFIDLANKGFYDGVIFHRVIPGFMIQGGDPTGTGMGGPGYCIPGEFAANGFPNGLNHTRGVLSMARALHPDTGGSQFFITFVPTYFLNGKHTVFGRVISGFENLAKITRDPDPKTPGFEPTKIIKAEVTYMPPQLKLPPVKKLPDNR